MNRWKKALLALVALAGLLAMAYHAWAEPILRSVAAARAQGMQIVTPRPGEKFEFGVPFVNKAWYLG